MVYILLGNGFETVEALAPADLLRRAGVPVTLVGVEGKQVLSGQNITVQADMTIDQVSYDNMEMLVLPGGLGGVNCIHKSIPAITMLNKAAELGLWVAAICAAPTILAHQGLLDRRTATVYPGMEEEMYSAVVDSKQSVVVDGRFMTGRAAGASFDFGLKLVEVLRGAEAAEKVRSGVHYKD